MRSSTLSSVVGHPFAPFPLRTLGHDMSRAANGDSPRTLLVKVWAGSLVRDGDGEPDLLYVDLHLVHEVTSAQAFEGLAAAGNQAL